MGEFTDIFSSVEDSTPSITDSKKPKKHKKPKKQKKQKTSSIVEASNPLDDLFSQPQEPNLSEQSNKKEPVPLQKVNDEKPKKSKWFKKHNRTQEEETSSDKKTNSTWTLVSEEQLVENEVPQEVEDIVDDHERVIGTRIKTELTINEARGLDLSIRDRIELTRKYLSKDDEERRKLEEYRAEEEKRANHVITLRNHILTELSVHLVDTNHELVMNIDTKFGPYIEEAMREVELGYFIKEIPRNADLVNLNPNLPYKYSFMVKAI